MRPLALRVEAPVIGNHDPPAQQPSYIPELVYDDSESQIPVVDYWS